MGDELSSSCWDEEGGAEIPSSSDCDEAGETGDELTSADELEADDGEIVVGELVSGIGGDSG